MQRKDGKRRAVEGVERKGNRRNKELMGKGRGCAEEEREEENRRRSGKDRAHEVEGSNWKRNRLCKRKMGRGEQ